MALGGHLKNRICFAQGQEAFLSEKLDDLSNPSDWVRFERIVKNFLKKKPKVISYDLHPEYASTKFAFSLDKTKFIFHPVQHHYAHLASCMVDNNIKNEKVIGVAFDGTGYGVDGTLWGGEFFLCNYNFFQRVGHFRAFPLLGAEMAIRQPWRVVLFWLEEVFRSRLWSLGLNYLKKIEYRDWQILRELPELKLNSPLTSSVGRLFDAVSSLVLNKKEARFEAELPMALERRAKRFLGKPKVYSFSIFKEKDAYLIEPKVLFRELVLDIRRNKPPEELAYHFHFTLAQMIQKMCFILSKESGIKKIVFSGGVFQNKLLVELVYLSLRCKNLKLYFPQQLSGNDSGIALGQAVIADFKVRV